MDLTIVPYLCVYDPYPFAQKGLYCIARFCYNSVKIGKQVQSAGNPQSECLLENFNKFILG